MSEVPFPAGGSREETTRILDHLAGQRLIRWSRDPEGDYTVELLPGANPAVTLDQALDEVLRTLGRLRPDARLGPAATRLLLMIGWRCRRKHGQVYPEDELIRAAELAGRDEFTEVLAQLDRCEADLVGSYPVEGYVEVGLLFD